MNELEKAADNKAISIAILSEEAKSLLKQQGCNAELFTQYIDCIGLCFIVCENWTDRMLIRASVFFNLAKEEMLTIDNIKRKSI